MMFAKFSTIVLFATLFQSLGAVSVLYPYFEFYADNDCQDGLALEWIVPQSNQPSSGYGPVVCPMVNASSVIVFTNETCILRIYTYPLCNIAIDTQASGELVCTLLPPPVEDEYYSPIFCLP